MLNFLVIKLKYIILKILLCKSYLPMDGRIMMAGIVCIASTTKPSAKALVKA